MIEQLNFYMTQATPALMESRREYIERVILGKLIRGICTMNAWSPETANQADAVELKRAYETALRFFTGKGFAPAAIAA